MKIGSTSGKMCWSILIFALVFLRVNVHSLSLYCKNPVMRKHFLILMCLRYSLPIWRSESLESPLTFSSDAFWERFGRVANCAFVGSCDLCCWEAGSRVQPWKKMIKIPFHQRWLMSYSTAVFVVQPGLHHNIYRFYDTYVLVLLHMLESGLSQVWNNIHVEGIVDLFQAIVHDLIVDGAAYIFRFLRFIFVSFKWITVCPCHIYFDPKVYLFLCRDLYIYIYDINCKNCIQRLWVCF